MIGPARTGPNRELVFGKTVPDNEEEVLVMKKRLPWNRSYLF